MKPGRGVAWARGGSSRRPTVWVFSLASVLLHAAGVWLLLPHGPAPGALDAPPLIEVEFVDQAPEVKGVAAAPAQPPPPSAQTAASEARTEPQAELPPPQAAAPPAPPSPAASPAPSAVNLDGGDEDQEGLLVTGRNVVQPQPDGTAHNKPPGYPAEAVRRGRQGVVVLLVHVTEQGLPAWVDVQTTSGDASLDRAAKDAVALWRFQPARSGGRTVPYDYEMSIRFSLDAR